MNESWTWFLNIQNKLTPSDLIWEKIKGLIENIIEEKYQNWLKLEGLRDQGLEWWVGKSYLFIHRLDWSNNFDLITNQILI